MGDALAPPARRTAEEVGHGDGNHREDARREDGGQPEPERDQQKRVELAASRALLLRRLSLRVSRRNRHGRRRCRGVHGQVRRPRPPPRHALFVAARLVARIHGDLHRPRAGVLLDLQLQQKRNLAFISFRIGIEVRVESSFGGRLERAIPLYHRIRREQNGEWRGRRRGHGIQVPARVDDSREPRQDLGARRHRARFQRQAPPDVLVLLSARAGSEQEQSRSSSAPGHRLLPCGAGLQPAAGYHPAPQSIPRESAALVAPSAAVPLRSADSRCRPRTPPPPGWHS